MLGRRTSSLGIVTLWTGSGKKQKKSKNHSYMAQSIVRLVAVLNADRRAMSIRMTWWVGPPLPPKPMTFFQPPPEDEYHRLISEGSSVY